MAKKGGWWGRSCTVDLHNCDKNLLTNPKAIEMYIHQLCKVLKMKRHGPTRIDCFGSGKLKGWSAMQFIETSSITVHCDEFGNRAFIDIFSCKKYDPKPVIIFSKKYFKAKMVSTSVEESKYLLFLSYPINSIPSSVLTALFLLEK